MRLIDADVLRERMYHDAFETDSDMQRWDSGCWIRYKMFENALDEQPTVDAEPVRHGHWIRKDYDIECSECHARIDERDLRWAIDTEAKYCLNCGCKMDEVEEDDA